MHWLWAERLSIATPLFLDHCTPQLASMRLCCGQLKASGAAGAACAGSTHSEQPREDRT